MGDRLSARAHMWVLVPLPVIVYQAIQLSGFYLLTYIERPVMDGVGILETWGHFVLRLPLTLYPILVGVQLAVYKHSMRNILKHWVVFISGFLLPCSVVRPAIY